MKQYMYKNHLKLGSKLRLNLNYDYSFEHLKKNKIHHQLQFYNMDANTTETIPT